MVRVNYEPLIRANLGLGHGLLNIKKSVVRLRYFR